MKKRLTKRAIEVSILCFLILIITTPSAGARVSSLVLEMLQNLDDLSQAGEQLALGQYEGVADAARALDARAEQMQGIDLASLGIDPARDSQWDAFLAAQRQAANSVAAAAKSQDAGGVLLGLQLLQQTACLGCHSTFRESNSRLRPATLFMTSFLSSLRGMNRGLALNDYGLVADQAREVAALARVMAWDPVIETNFGIADAPDRKLFRSLANRLATEAGRIERGAADEDATTVLQGVRSMWMDGCIACHDKFR